MSGSRLVLPLYLWLYPGNVAAVLLGGDARPQYRPITAALLVLWVSSQVLLMYVQQRFGPRCFVPARLLPAKYNYRRRIPQEVLER